MFRAPDLVIIGTGPLADAALAALARRRLRVVRFEDIAGADRHLAGARVVLLIAGEHSGAALARLAELWARTSRSGQRVVLLSGAGAPLPPSLPAMPAPVERRLEHVILEDAAARRLLARWPLHLGFDPAFGQRLHLLLAGRSALADALLAQALRVGHYSDCPPVITLLDPAPDVWQAAVAGALPEAGHAGELRFRPVSDPGLGDAPPVSSGIVCVAPPGTALETAETLAARLARERGISPPLLVEVGDVPTDGELPDWDGQILPFSARRMVLTPEVLLDGGGDELARVIHGHYRDTTAAQGRDPGAEPSGRPWSDLADSYRDANRRQADHLGAKLAVTDCVAVAEELVESFAFAPTEVERLAVIEHARWAADRYLDGWTYAPVRDNARKHHPQLIPYADLSGPMKDLDRFAVRLVPALLARSGRALMRMLIVGVVEDAAGVGGGLRGPVDQVVNRLCARYPDRALVIASTLAGPGGRLLARRARQLADAGLFLLCPGPVSGLLDAQPGADARLDCLGLIAVASRRISLPGEGEVERWLAERAEILVQIGSHGAAGGDAGADDGGRPRKRVWIDPGRGVDWGFEY